VGHICLSHKTKDVYLYLPRKRWHNAHDGHAVLGTVDKKSIMAYEIFPDSSMMQAGIHDLYE
jgi:hypothetical protein